MLIPSPARIALTSSDFENAPELLSVGRALPPHYADQDTLIAALREEWVEQHYNLDRLEELHRAVQVNGRYLALPIAEYAALRSVATRNGPVRRGSGGRGVRRCGQARLTARAACGGDPFSVLPGHRASDGLGRGRRRVQDRPLSQGSPAGDAEHPARRGLIPRRPGLGSHANRALDGTHRRSESPSSIRIGARVARPIARTLVALVVRNGESFLRFRAVRTRRVSRGERGEAGRLWPPARDGARVLF